MKIRDAMSSDKATVLEFCKDTFSWGDYVADVWDRWQSKGQLYVVEDDGKVVGVYNLAISEKQAWIEGMRVHPKYRRKGLGKSMLSYAESIIQNKTTRLIIESENHPSIMLAKSMGYYLEEKWRLYSMHPEKQPFDVKIANDILQVKNLINSVTYVDSWKWLPLDSEELQKLIDQERVVMSVDNDKTLAMGVWNRYGDFPRVFQVGYLNGTKGGMVNILRYIQNKAYDLNCERIQIFVYEKTSLEADFLDKKSLFYLMRKDIRKIYNA
ncbi:MAG: GNAT family N-acetyltransferase [Nitrosotalea sp.]